ncbi:MAG TPA: hypothetical protein VI009_22115 [Xanthobacteraceae bacterium]|jgi:hypothetical protein
MRIVINGTEAQILGAEIAVRMSSLLLKAQAGEKANAACGAAGALRPR